MFRGTLRTLPGEIVRANEAAMSRPLVSVVMPTFERRALLAAAIDSVRAQTLDDFELLVVDDASTDGTEALLAERARADPRVRVFRATVNRGCNAARTLALGEARGRYLAFLDDDDLYLPERLERAVARLEAESSLDVAFCRFSYIDAAGEPQPWGAQFLAVGEDATPGAQVFPLLYCDWGWIPTCTLTLRADRLAGVAFGAARRRDSDAVFNVQLAAAGATFAQLPESLALVRRDRAYSFLSADRAALLADRRESLVLLRQWLGQRGDGRFEHLHARAWSNHLLREAEFLGGARGAARALRALLRWPGNPAAWAYFQRRISRR